MNRDSSEAILLSEVITFSSHRAVHSAFAQRFIKTGKLPEKMHRSLIRAFQKRQIGEYEAEPDFTAEEVRTLQEDAVEFIHSAKQFLSA